MGAKSRYELAGNFKSAAPIMAAIHGSEYLVVGECSIANSNDTGSAREGGTPTGDRPQRYLGPGVSAVRGMHQNRHTMAHPFGHPSVVWTRERYAPSDDP